MPTGTEITMAKLLVATLGLDKKEGLMDLLCEDDPGKVVHLFQLQQQRLSSPRVLATAVDLSTTTEKDTQALPVSVPVAVALGGGVEEAKNNSTSNAGVPPNAANGDDLAMGRPGTDGNGNGQQDAGDEDSEKEDAVGEEDEEENEDGSDFEMLEDAGGHQTINESPVPIRPSGKIKPSRTRSYVDFPQFVQDRVDRLFVYDQEYRLKGGNEVYAIFRRWVCHKEKAKVAAGELSSAESFSTSKAVYLCFYLYGHGASIKFPSLARYNTKSQLVPNPAPRLLAAVTTADPKTATRHVRVAKRARVGDSASSTSVPARTRSNKGPGARRRTT